MRRAHRDVPQCLAERGEILFQTRGTRPISFSQQKFQARTRILLNKVLTCEDRPLDTLGQKLRHVSNFSPLWDLSARRRPARHNSKFSLQSSTRRARARALALSLPQ